MINKLHSIVGTKIMSISRFFIQLLLLSLITFSAPNAIAATMDKDFDHYNTNFPLDGGHARARCDACHIRGIFKGTPTACKACHDTNSKVAQSRMPVTHVKTVGTCDTCHTDKNWKQVRMDHSAVTGTCKSCHGAIPGITPMPTSNHPRTSLDCDECHRDRAWKPASGYVHSPQDVVCTACHGTTAQGLSPNHILLAVQECSTCHANDRPTLNRPRFSPISERPMDHSVLQNQSNCQAVGCHASDVNNLPNFHKTGIINSGSGACGDCHSDAKNWTNAPMDHALATPDQCQTCHTGSATKGKKAAEFQHGNFMASPSNQCDTCHKTPPGRAGAGGFGPSQLVNNLPHDMLNQAQCGYCHDPNRLRYTTKTITQVQDHARITANIQCGLCHDNPPGSFKLRLQRGETHRLEGNKQCGVCHASTLTYPSSGKKLGAGGNHKQFAGDASNCRACHGTDARYQDGFDHDASLNGNNRVTCHLCHDRNGPRYPESRPRQEKEPIDHDQPNQTTCLNGNCHNNTLPAGKWD